MINFRYTYLSVSIIVLVLGLFFGCSNPNNIAELAERNNTQEVVSISSIPGVTPPARYEMRVTEITETDQYSGTVSWSPNDYFFRESTVYTATITLTPKSGFTLTGIGADFFKVAGATSVSNDEDSGVVTAVFPTVNASIDLAAIPSVAAPAYGETPVTEITETDQYTGTVSWSPSVSGTFDYETEYTATIMLTAKSGYTLSGVRADYFSVAGATSVSNDADSGVVTAVFPATEFEYAIGDRGPANGWIFYIDTADEYIWTYLEVAPATTEWGDKEWGDKSLIGGDAKKSGIGDGQIATDAIVAHMEDENINDTAAQNCDGLEYVHDGKTYKDWFLPSKYELKAIWDNLVDDGNGNNSGVGGFANIYDSYWSSTEFKSDSAYTQVFTDGDSNITQKSGYPYRVRAVRAF